MYVKENYYNRQKLIIYPGILVRNEAAREELRKQVGEIGLILHVYFMYTHNLLWPGFIEPFMRAKA